MSKGEGRGDDALWRAARRDVDSESPLCTVMMTFFALAVKEGIDLEHEPDHHHHDTTRPARTRPSGLLSIEPI
jgi:hypothetical protein